MKIAQKSWQPNILMTATAIRIGVNTQEKYMDIMISFFYCNCNKNHYLIVLLFTHLISFFLLLLLFHIYDPLKFFFLNFFFFFLWMSIDVETITVPWTLKHARGWPWALDFLPSLTCFSTKSSPNRPRCIANEGLHNWKWDEVTKRR